MMPLKLEAIEGLTMRTR